MSVAKLTQAEAQRLLEMIKRSLITEIEFPTSGKSVEFGVRGDTKKDTFSVNIYRGKIQPLKYNIGARIKKNGIMLLDLHIIVRNLGETTLSLQMTSKMMHLLKIQSHF